MADPPPLDNSTQIVQTTAAFDLPFEDPNPNTPRIEGNASSLASSVPTLQEKSFFLPGGREPVDIPPAVTDLRGYRPNPMGFVHQAHPTPQQHHGPQLRALGTSIPSPTAVEIQFFRGRGKINYGTLPPQNSSPVAKTTTPGATKLALPLGNVMDPRSVPF